jgi:hypothetical protein
MRGDANEHVNVEVAMFLRELLGDRQAKVVQGDAMDIDIKHKVP